MKQYYTNEIFNKISYTYIDILCMMILGKKKDSGGRVEKKRKINY